MVGKFGKKNFLINLFSFQETVNQIVDSSAKNITNDEILDSVKHNDGKIKNISLKKKKRIFCIWIR